VVVESRSESVEMYLKSLAELGGGESPVSIGRVAERLEVSPVSASEMMKRLVDQGLVTHQPYKGVILTRNGLRVAEGVIRKQRLWECFLVDHLQIDWAQAHDLACDLEHATGQEVTEALDLFLGHPTVCPHGNPIPRHDSRLPNLATISLRDLPIGRKSVVTAIAPHSSEALAYLAKIGVRPGQIVEVLGAEPLRGPLSLMIGKEQAALGLGLAELIIVQPEQDDRQ